MAGPKTRLIPDLSPETRERFWAKVDQSGGIASCWPWTGALDKDGYGWFSIHPYKPFRANRVAWVYAHGEPTPGLLICHACNNPICANPNSGHLYVDDSAGNSGYMAECGRAATGDRNGSRLHPERLKRGKEHPLVIDPSRAARGIASGVAKLNDDKVRAIRIGLRFGRSLNSLAQEHHVSKKTIVNIKLGRIWKHVTEAA